MGVSGIFAPGVAVPARLVMVGSRVAAGYPSPAQDYFDGSIDLNEHLIKDRTSTFVLQVAGDSMQGAGIFDGDRLIVDRAKEPVHGSIVIAVLDGELTVKRLLRTGRGPVLAPENPAYPQVLVPKESELLIWGVVTWCLHHVA